MEYDVKGALDKLDKILFFIPKKFKDMLKFLVYIQLLMR